MHARTQPEDYIIMTNSDFFFGDERETFDGTSGHKGESSESTVCVHSDLRGAERRDQLAFVCVRVSVCVCAGACA